MESIVVLIDTVFCRKLTFRVNSMRLKRPWGSRITNIFNQFPLTESTLQYLAVHTPWGLVEPLFLPEGVSPVSGHLQCTMMQMMRDFRD